MNTDPVIADTNRYLRQIDKEQAYAEECERRANDAIADDNQLNEFIADAFLIGRPHGRGVDGAELLTANELFALYRDGDWISFGEALQCLVEEFAIALAADDIENEIQRGEEP